MHYLSTAHRVRKLSHCAHRASTNEGNAARIGVNATTNRVNAAIIGVNAVINGANAARIGVNATINRVNAAIHRVNTVINGANAARIGVNATINGVNAAINGVVLAAVDMHNHETCEEDHLKPPQRTRIQYRTPTDTNGHRRLA
eukprot:1261166-Rhodomonas_salina.1